MLLLPRFALAIGFASLLVGCQSEPTSQPVSLRFEAFFEGAPLACAAPARSKEGSSIELSDLRLFVHDVRLVREDGALVPVALTPDGAFQSRSVAMLDFEDGTGLCDNGSHKTHTTLEGRVAPGRYRGVRLQLGVPFEENHQNPALAEAPLDQLSMHWGWQAGYKFFRLGLHTEEGGYRVHLGSTGCAGSASHVTGCDRENRAEIAVDGLDLDSGIVALDVARLLPDKPSLGDDKAGCMGDKDDPGCPLVFTALGLDLESGSPRAPAALFGAR